MNITITITTCIQGYKNHTYCYNISLDSFVLIFQQLVFNRNNNDNMIVVWWIRNDPVQWTGMHSITWSINIDCHGVLAISRSTLEWRV